jgi:hypothetical protein
MVESAGPDAQGYWPTAGVWKGKTIVVDRDTLKNLKPPSTLGPPSASVRATLARFRGNRGRRCVPLQTDKWAARGRSDGQWRRDGG